MTQQLRNITVLDRFLGETSHFLATAFADPGAPDAAYPGKDCADSALPSSERALSEGLMRINHTGEIAAQALYRGQAAVASDLSQRQALLTAAAEEQDHLCWCQQRLTELEGRKSHLAPAWYMGSFLIGLAAGLAGDRWSLGFVEETEVQVSAHLDSHLERLPAADHRSRAVVAQMRKDEARHAEMARAAGARPLPKIVQKTMTQIANVMRLVSFRI